LLASADMGGRTELEGADETAEFAEGRVAFRVHAVHERNSEAVRRKKNDAHRRQGRLQCEACGFDFGAGYDVPGSEQFQVK
jgi:5-methylcytosine-specific restriction protein A